MFYLFNTFLKLKVALQKSKKKIQGKKSIYKNKQTKYINLVYGPNIYIYINK